MIRCDQYPRDLWTASSTYSSLSLEVLLPVPVAFEDELIAFTAKVSWDRIDVFTAFEELW